MTISIGEKIPSVTVKHLGPEGMDDLSLDSLLTGKRVVLFGVPAAYSATCSEQHVPGYVANAALIKGKGIDQIICHSVNDPFVMKAWARDQKADNDLIMFPDGDATLARALGMDVDLAGAGLGIRSQRYALIARDGVVEYLAIEASPPEHKASSADAILRQL